MKSHEVLRKAIKPVGCKHVAAELKLSTSLIYQWSRGKDGKSAALNPLDRVALLVELGGEELLVELGGEELLDWLCRQRGGRFVRAEELPALVRRCWEEFKKEMDALLKAEGERRKAEAANCPAGGRPAEGFRCRHRLPGGRCGFRQAQRN